jgi:hypothetical protein
MDKLIKLILFSFLAMLVVSAVFLMSGCSCCVRKEVVNPHIETKANRLVVNHLISEKMIKAGFICIEQGDYQIVFEKPAPQYMSFSKWSYSRPMLRVIYTFSKLKEEKEVKNDEGLILISTTSPLTEMSINGVCRLVKDSGGSITYFPVDITDRGCGDLIQEYLNNIKEKISE